MNANSKKINELKAEIDARKDYLDWVYPESERDEIMKRDSKDIDRINLIHHIRWIKADEKRLSCLLKSF